MWFLWKILHSIKLSEETHQYNSWRTKNLKTYQNDRSIKVVHVICQKSAIDHINSNKKIKFYLKDTKSDHHWSILEASISWMPQSQRPELIFFEKNYMTYLDCTFSKLAMDNRNTTPFLLSVHIGQSSNPHYCRFISTEVSMDCWHFCLLSPRFDDEYRIFCF